MVKERNARVERLRWQLLAAVSGIGVAAVTCGGQSSTDEKRASDPKGGASGAGARGGASGAGALGGSGGASGTSTGGDSSGAGGESGGNPTGGQGPSGGTAGGPGRELGECENPRDHNGLIRCDDGYVHRPTATECPFPPRDGVAGGGGESGGAGAAARQFAECATDDDCGPNGYCVYDLVDANVCVQAECQSDADCPDAHVCACETFDDVAGIGQCVPASCTTDDDCAGAAFCISPLGVNGCFAAQASVFHCQTTADECWGPETCVASPQECMRDAATSRFVCNPNAESCGRPFIVGGVARRASAVHVSDWSSSEGSVCSESALEELSESERLEIARHFTDAGLMEHASIAAFARFSLQLLALGAPPHLVEGAVRAMADETRHARVCFGLARRYGMTRVGPGPLAMDGALERVNLLDVARLVIVEGCIGETVAALEASFAAGEASDPELRRALESIADDETRHAALAFRFIAWAAKREPRVARLFERSIGEARALATEPSGRAPNERSRRLARHGVLDRAARGEARRRALNEVIPSLFALAEPIRELEQRVPAQVVA